MISRCEDKVVLEEDHDIEEELSEEILDNVDSDYDEYNEDEEEDSDYDELEEQFDLVDKKIEKFELLNKDHQTYITEYFDEIINKIDVTSEELLQSNKLPEESIRKEQARLVEQIKPIQQSCLKKYLLNNRDPKDLTSQFDGIIASLKEKIKESTSKRPYTCNDSITERTDKVLRDLAIEIDEEFVKAEFKLLSGYRIHIVGHTIDIRCSYDYETVNSEPISEHECELIYTFESMNNFKFDEESEHNEMFEIFRKTNDSEKVIEYLKLLNKLEDVPKTFTPIDCIEFDFAVSREDKLENYRNFFQLGFGLISGKYAWSKNGIKNKLYKRLKDVTENPMNPRRMIRHILTIAKHVNVTFTTNQWNKLNKNYEMACEDEFETDMSNGEIDYSDSDDSFKYYYNDYFDHSFDYGYDNIY